MTVNERFFKLIDDQKISQKTVANKLNVSEKTLSAWRTRGTDLPAKLIIPACRLFNVTIEFLLGNIEITDVLLDDEVVLLNNYRQLSLYDKVIINGEIARFLKEQQNKKGIASAKKAV